MQITVQFFGHYRDYAPEPLALALPEGTTVQQLAALLAERDARFGDLTRYCRFAQNEEYVTLDTVLLPDAYVVVLPPMSGG